MSICTKCGLVINSEETLSHICEESKIPVIGRRQEIINKLNDLDLKIIRPLLEGETSRVEEIKAQKTVLRNELNSLIKEG